MKCKTIPVITGALGAIQKATEKLITTILAADDHLDEIQNIALMGTSHILPKYLLINNGQAAVNWLSFAVL